MYEKQVSSNAVGFDSYKLCFCGGACRPHEMVYSLALVQICIGRFVCKVVADPSSWEMGPTVPMFDYLVLLSLLALSQAALQHWAGIA